MPSVRVGAFLPHCCSAEGAAAGERTRVTLMKKIRIGVIWLGLIRARVICAHSRPSPEQK